MEENPTKTVTIDESTKQQYRRNYFRLERMARKEFSIPEEDAVSPQQVAAMFLDNEPGWSASTAKLYRASLVFVFKGMNDVASNEAIDMVYHVSDDGEWRMQLQERLSAERKKRKRNSPRTSAQKAKAMTSEDLLVLREALDSSRSKWARDTRLWFFAAVLTGLRPTEWQRATLTTDKKGNPELKLMNAKNTNGRAHGVERTIGLKKMSESNIALIAAHLKTAQFYTDIGEFSRWYDNCRIFLRSVSDRLWPRRIRHPSLYTARHVFGADAKQQFDRIGVAALMGHASTNTAYEHYGKRHTGTGGISVTPSDADMEAVAKRNPGYVPGDPASEGSPSSKFSKVHNGDKGASNRE